MDELERVPQPRTLLDAEATERPLEVVLVLVLVMLGLVEELDLRRDGRNSRRRRELDLGHRSPQRRIAAADPDSVRDVVQEELELVRLELPLLGRRAHARRAREHLVHRQLEPLAVLPRIPEAGSRALV